MMICGMLANPRKDEHLLVALDGYSDGCVWIMPRDNEDMAWLFNVSNGERRGIVTADKREEKGNE